MPIGLVLVGNLKAIDVLVPLFTLWVYEGQFTV